MPISSAPHSFVSRFTAATALVTISLLTGAIFTIKAPPTGLPPTGTVQTLRLQNGSGAQVGACYDNGNCSFSGSVLAGGVALMTISGNDARYVNISGDTMTGGLLIQNGGTPGTIDTGLLLEIAGSASGRILHAQDQLRSSGALIVDGAATFNHSSFRILDSGFANCTSLETVSGVLTCGTDGGDTYFAGQGLTLTSTVFSLSSSFSGSSLEIFGTSSGRIIHAQDLLRSSGALAIEGNSFFQGNTTTAGTMSGRTLWVDGVQMGTGTVISLCSNSAQSTTLRMTAAEQTFDTNCVIPANSVSVGDKFRITATGSGSATAAFAAWYYQFGLNSTPLIPTTALLNYSDFVNDGANVYFQLNGIMNILSTGASGEANFYFEGRIPDPGDNTASLSQFSINRKSAFDTTVSNTFNMTASGTAINTALYTTLTNFLVEKIRK